MAAMKAPNSRRDLDEAVKRVYGGLPEGAYGHGERHQIAQKFHAVSVPGSDRAHDLIDLQVICKMGDVDLRRAREARLRLFAYRQQQQWPLAITSDDRWSGL